MSRIRYDDVDVLVTATCVRPVVSVVVALYNKVEGGYLERLLESFDAQRCEGVEYVLCDDCSTDSSLTVAAEFARAREDITVLHLRENGRQGAARNRAISYARGRYISIVDADDYIGGGFFESVLHAIGETDADVVVNKWIQRVDAEGELLGPRYANLRNSELSGRIDRDARRHLINCHWQFGTWRASLFDDARNLYPEGMFYEDTPTVMRWLMQIGSVAVADATYFYRSNPSSTTQTTGTNKDMLADRLRSSDMILDNARELGVYDEFKDEFDCYYVEVALANTLLMLRMRDIAYACSLASHVRGRVPDFMGNHLGKQGGMKRSIRLRGSYRRPLALLLLHVLHKRVKGIAGARRRSVG